MKRMLADEAATEALGRALQEALGAWRGGNLP
jgi:hypothetical protein